MPLNGLLYLGRNIVLDFLDRANREIYGLYENLLDEAHIFQLVEALRIRAKTISQIG